MSYLVLPATTPRFSRTQRRPWKASTYPGVVARHSAVAAGSATGPRLDRRAERPLAQLDLWGFFGPIRVSDEHSAASVTALSDRFPSSNYLACARSMPLICSPRPMTLWNGLPRRSVTRAPLSFRIHFCVSWGAPLAIPALGSGGGNYRAEVMIARYHPQRTKPSPHAPRPATSTPHASPEPRRTSHDDRRSGHSGRARARRGRRGAPAPIPARVPVSRARQTRRHKSRLDNSRPGADRCRRRPPCVPASITAAPDRPALITELRTNSAWRNGGAGRLRP